MPNLILYTGNTLQTKLLRPSTNLSQHLNNVLQNTSIPSTSIDTPTGPHLVCPAPNTPSNTNINNSNEITAKLFLPKGISVEQAILNVKTALRAFKDCFYEGTRIKYFIISFGGLLFSDNEDEEDQVFTDDDIFKVWTSIVEAGNSEHLADNSVLIEQYGVSEFSTQRLNTLLENIASSSSCTTRPTINHINAADCCALPQSLVTLAKKVGIKLLAHHDPENLLLQRDVDSLAVEIVKKFEKETDPSLKCSTEPNSHQWNWILKMTHLAKDRQVLTRNEALVSIGLRK